MINEKHTQNTNNIKFVLYQDKNIITEQIFSGNVFNPVIRYSVDIRENIPSIIQRLQLAMSRRNLTYSGFGYNFLNYYQDLIDFYSVDENKLSKPTYVKYNYGNKVIKGVECKFGLYINDNPIVERKFYVDNYNPACRFSLEIVEIVNEITDEINQLLKELDIDYMWGDHILANSFGLYPNQVRELSKSRRKEMIDNYNDRNFIKKIKTSYRSK